jgi:hypothetical protein
MSAKETKEYTLQINLIHGKPVRIKADLNELQRRNLAQALERAMDSGYLGVDLEDTLTVIPLSNVSTIDVSPAPGGVMRSVARNARRG